MKKIYLHIGSEKTGTTYIQSTFKNNRDLLEKSGFIYPSTGYGDSTVAHSSLVAPLCKLEQSNPNLDFVPHCDFTEDQEWNKLSELIENNIDKNIVISSEHFSSRLKCSGIDYIKNFFDKYSATHEIKVVIYIRRQDEFVSSAYSTHIKSGGKLSKSDFFDKALNRDYYFDFRKLIESWSSRFGKASIIVKPYEKLQLKEGLLIDFCKTIGFNDYSSFKLPNKSLNESLSTFAMNFGCIVNKSLAGVENVEKRKVMNFISNSTLDVDIDWVSSRDKALLLYEYMDDNEYIARYYMNRDDGKLFYEPYPKLKDAENTVLDESCIVETFVNLVYQALTKGN